MENIKEVPAILEACKRIKAMGGKRVEAAPTVVRGGIETTRISWLEEAICDCCLYTYINSGLYTFEDAIFINEPVNIGDCVEEKEEVEVYNYWE